MFLVGLAIGLIGIVAGLVFVSCITTPLSLVATVIGVLGIAGKDVIKKRSFRFAICSFIVGIIPIAIGLIKSVNLYF